MLEYHRGPYLPAKKKGGGGVFQHLTSVHVVVKSFFFSQITVNTTGTKNFAQCPKHSATPWIHTTKALPSTSIFLAKISLPSVFYRALSKAFAECQKTLNKVYFPETKKWSEKRAKIIIFLRGPTNQQPSSSRIIFHALRYHRWNSNTLLCVHTPDTFRFHTYYS